MLKISYLDLGILLAYTALTLFLGVWLGSGQRKLKDYLLGGRDLPWWAILGSIVATETSTATFLSVPGIAFATGGDFRFLQLTIGYLIGRTMVAWVLLPMFMRGDFYSAYDVLAIRFGRATQSTASAIFLVTRNLGDGLRLYLAALALTSMTGMSLWLCVAIVGCITIGYTMFGGMKSVIWNDCLQFVVYTIGGIVAAYMMISSFDGGLAEVLEFGRAQGKFRIFDFSFDLTKSYTFWSGLVGGTFLTLGTHGTDQMLVQRYLCARSYRDGATALIASSVVVALQFALFLFIGVCLACFYQDLPKGEPLASDKAFAKFIVEGLPVGLVGLTLAAVFSAAMSTLSSSLNSSATSMVNDIVFSKTVDDETKLGWTRVFTFVFGVLQIYIAMVASRLSQSVVTGALAIAGFSAGLLLGTYTLSALPRAGQPSAIAGFVGGTLTLTLIKFNTPLAWPWFPLVGLLATVAVGFVFSLLFPRMTSMQVVTDERM